MDIGFPNDFFRKTFVKIFVVGKGPKGVNNAIPTGMRKPCIVFCTMSKTAAVVDHPACRVILGL